EIIDKILALVEGTKLYLLAPIERRGQEKYEALWEEIRRTGFVRLRVDGHSYNVEEPPTIDHRRKHLVEVVVDRVIVRAIQRSRRADGGEGARDLGKGVLNVAHVDDRRPEPDWKVERFSQHYVCDRCGRSFEPLNPHHFSFNSPLGWCPTCEGLGNQKGANPAVLVRDPTRSLRDGALAAWPALTRDNPFSKFAHALSQHVGFSLDAPFEKLNPGHQRSILHGTGDDWIALESDGRGLKSAPRSHAPALRVPHFQYKGLLPAIDEASRVSFVYRHRLDHLVSDVPCAACQGSRLR